jgi:DNA-binding CsgD family transcriptional regulator
VAATAVGAGLVVAVTSHEPRLLTVEEVLQSGEPLLVLKAHTLRAAVALVPSVLAVFIGVTRRLRIQDAVGLQSHGVGFSVRGEWHRYLSESQEHDPFSPDAVEPATTVLALEEVEAGSRRYADLLRAAGLGDRIAVYLRSSGTIVAVITLVRALDDPRFTRAEAVSLRRVQPLFEHAYLCALEPSAGPRHTVLRDSGLTSREADVAELVGRGATNAEIACSLNVTESTVKTHLTRIFAKVGVRSRTQLAIVIGGDPAVPDES